MGISQDYLEMLHANHEDWLRHGLSPAEFRRSSEAVLNASGGLQADGCGCSVTARCGCGWQLQLLQLFLVGR